MTLGGNLGADAQIRALPGKDKNGNSTSVANFSIACTRRFTSNGEKQEDTQWFRCTLYGKQAEAVGPYLTKGKQVIVSGRLEWGKPYDREMEVSVDSETVNAQVPYTPLNIILDNVQLVGSKRDDDEETEPVRKAPSTSKPSAKPAPKKSAAKTMFADDEDDEDGPSF